MPEAARRLVRVQQGACKGELKSGIQTGTFYG